MKKKMVGMAAALICFAMLFSGTKTRTAYAAEGWASENGIWEYLDGSGRPVSNTWEPSGDDWYYLDSDGRLAKNSLIESENGLFYVNATGKRADSRWILINSESNSNSNYKDGWYYFEASGKACKGARKQIEGKIYAFDEAGTMVTGWVDADGNALDEGSDPITDGVFYAGEDGALLKDDWLDYSATASFRFPDMESRVSGLNYGDYKEIWLYFDSGSKRVRGTGDSPRQKKIDGNIYGFDENGIMIPWWSKVATDSNSIPTNPTTVVPPRFYSPYNGGKLLKNTWIYMYPSENLDAQDYQAARFSWWRTDGNGKVYQNTIKKINGKRYAFDGLGRMQGGFVVFRGRDEFVSRFDTDSYGSENFKNGSILGLEDGSSLYLFAPDVYNDGSMQTGKNIKVELNDGIYAFGFDRNGVAYGNRGLCRVEDSYYINGLRLDADADYGYGTVIDQNGTARLVDTRGRVVEGGKRIVKDSDGAWLILVNGKFMARVTDEEKPRWHKGPEGPGFYHYDNDTGYGAMITDGTEAPQLSTLPQEEQLYSAIS